MRYFWTFYHYPFLDSLAKSKDTFGVPVNQILIRFADGKVLMRPSKTAVVGRAYKKFENTSLSILFNGSSISLGQLLEVAAKEFPSAPLSALRIEGTSDRKILISDYTRYAKQILGIA